MDVKLLQKEVDCLSRKKHLLERVSVLVIKSADQNMENSKLEQELKSKFRPGSMNANVIGTRLIKVVKTLNHCKI
nr:unnamed protein product [Callosobruchus analis]